MPTLYLIGRGTQTRLAEHHLQVRQFDEEEHQLGPARNIPLLDIERIAVVGRPVLTTATLHELLRRGIPVHLVSRYGRWSGSFAPARDGDAAVRIEQYRRHGSAWSKETAARMVYAKLLNSRRVIQKLAAGLENRAAFQKELDDNIDTLKRLAERARACRDLDELRGYEGTGAARYYQGLRLFFPEAMPFKERSRRPPKDEVNALLSWTYTLVHAEIAAAVRQAGLDPCIGALHELDYGRPSLSLDLMEPLRAPLCDLLVLRLCNLKILGPDDFDQDAEKGGYKMKKEAMKKYFLQYEQRMERFFKRSGHTEHTTFRRVLVDEVEKYQAALKSAGRYDPFFMP